VYAKRSSPGVSEAFLPVPASASFLVAGEDGQSLMNITIDGGELPGGVTPPEVVTPAPKHRVEAHHHHADGSTHLVSPCCGLDLTSDQGHSAIGRPFLKRIAVRSFPGPHLAVRKIEEDKTVLTLRKASDPGLVRVQSQSQCGQDHLNSPSSLLDPTLARTQDDKVITIPHQHPQTGALRDLFLIQHMERDVRQQRGNRR
jgi:hypothetical protein